MSIEMSDPIGTEFDRAFTGPAEGSAALSHLGTLRQVLPVSVERLFENALDWEHLPWLHASSFSSIEKTQADGNGWTALAGSTGGSVLKIRLRLEREHRRWITTTLAGQGEGSEIWTHVSERGERETLVVVDFFAPGVSGRKAAAAGEKLRALYSRLYDEDVRMMLDRQAALDEQSARERIATTDVVLGGVSEIRAKVPFGFEAFGRSWRLVEAEGQLLVHPGRCPHRLGSLLDASIDGAELLCPWHGYRFDLRSGECVSGARCRLERAPVVLVDDGRAVVRFVEG